MSRATRALGPLGLVGFLLFLPACDGSFLDPSLDIPVDGEFSLEPSGISLEVGETITIVASLVRPNNQPINPRALQWESTTPVTASVDRDGVVLALAPGRTLIIASSGQLADTTDVMVVPAGADKSGITLTPSELELDWLGATTHLTANVYDEDGTLVANPQVRWTSADPEVVQVDDMGKVTAQAVGAALIVATAVCCDQADTAHAQVRQVVASVSMATQSVSLAVGETRQLSAQALDEGGSSVEDASFEWSSSNTSVATVSSGGLVTARGGGNATITAKSGDASGSTSVTVEDGNTSGPPADGGIAELPRAVPDVSWPGYDRVVDVAPGQSIQAALDNARPGDFIRLAPGATYYEQITLPPNDGAVILIGSLPPDGRARPGSGLPRIVGTNSTRRVISAPSTASNYRLVGLEAHYEGVEKTSSVISVSHAHNIVLDRVVVGGEYMELQRAVLLNGTHLAVVDSWLMAGYKGADSQAILIYSGAGPYLIEGNYLAAAGENIMVGGATAQVLPADITIRRNHLHKPDAWRDGRFTVKNLFEIKFGVRFLLEGNVLEGNWRDGQDGHGINIKLSSAGAGDRISDFTFRYNIFHNSDHGFKIGSSFPRVLIENNVTYDIPGRLSTILSSSDLHLRYNTFRHGGNIITSTGGNSGFVAVGNIWGGWRDGESGGYGVKGSGAEGTSTLDADFPGWEYHSNGHIGRVESRYPEGNLFVSTEDDARFMDVAGGDLRLRSDSPFANIGADMQKLLEHTAGVVQ
jgi:uncharacterized protein YjdB